MMPDEKPYPVGTYVNCPLCGCREEGFDPGCPLCFRGWMQYDVDCEEDEVGLWTWLNEDGNHSWVRFNDPETKTVMRCVDRFSVPDFVQDIIDGGDPSG